MVVMTHNTDVADSWEREGEDADFFYQFSPRGYALGVDVLLHIMLEMPARRRRRDRNGRLHHHAASAR